MWKSVCQENKYLNFVDKFLGVPTPELTHEAENKNKTNIIKNWIKKQ